MQALQQTGLEHAGMHTNHLFRINKVVSFFPKASLVALEALFSCLCMYVHVQLHFSQQAERTWGPLFFSGPCGCFRSCPWVFSACWEKSRAEWLCMNTHVLRSWKQLPKQPHETLKIRPSLTVWKQILCTCSCTFWRMLVREIA